MPNHDHHRCECEHERVKFCAKCKVVHCLDCKQEWNEPCQRAHGWTYPYWGGSATTYTIGAQSGGSSLINPTNAQITFATSTECEH